MRERLIELIESTRYWGSGTSEEIADYLLANGVIVPPCKVGDTVWVYNSITGKIYENTVVCIKMRSKGACRNTMSLEYTNAHKETSCRKFKWAQVGKQVFLTKEEAETALKGGAE